MMLNEAMDCFKAFLMRSFFILFIFMYIACSGSKEVVGISNEAVVAVVNDINITLDEYRNRLKHDLEVSETLLMSFEDVINSINQGEFFTAPFIAVCFLFIVNSKNI